MASLTDGRTTISAVPYVAPVKPSAITPQQLTSAVPIQVAQPKPSTSMDGLSAFIGQTAVQNKDDFTQAQAQQTELARAKKDDTLSALLQGMRAPGETQLTNDALEETGANTAQKEVQTLNSQLLAEQHALDRQLQALEKNPEGLFGGALADEMRRVKGESLARQADIAVVLNAKQGQYDIARQIADRAVAAKLEVQRNNLDAIKLMYQDNKDIFDKAEQRQMDTLIRDRERGLEMTEYQEKARFDQMIRQQDPLYQANLKKARADADAAVQANQPIVVPTDAGTPAIEGNTQALQGIFSSSKVSPANKTAIGNGLALAKAAQDLAEANSSGNFSGFYPLRGVVDFFTPEAFKRKQTVQNDALISALNLQTQFWASGAALTEAQTKEVMKMIPVKTDTDTQVKVKANNLVNYMLSQTASRLITDGIKYEPAKVDLFETTDLLDKASPEQLDELRAQQLIQ